MISTYYSNEKNRRPEDPVAWFDASMGVSDDLSRWESRLGELVAVQPQADARFTRGPAYGWLYSSDASRNMVIANVPFDGVPAMSALVVAKLHGLGPRLGRALLVGGDLVLYTYEHKAEFFISDRAGGGSNPTAYVQEDTVSVIGGDAQAGRYSSSRTWVNGVLQGGYNRTGAFNGTFDNTAYTIGAAGGSSGYGELRHVLFFDYVLSDQQRTDWTALLLSPAYSSF